MRKKTLLLPIREILPKVLQKWSVDSKVVLWSLQEKWLGLVGTALGRRTRPARIHGSLLIIGVENSAWANELQLMQSDILEKINRDFPEIKTLRFQTEISSSGRIG